jgi:hypothetical protein
MPTPRNPRRKNGLVWLTCPVCQTTFTRTAYDVNTGRNVCCSWACKSSKMQTKRQAAYAEAVK